MFTKKTLWVLLALVVAIVLLYGLSVHTWDPKALAEDEWRGVPYWVWMVVAAVAATAIWFGNKRKLLSLVATAVVIIFAIVVYRSYRDGWLMSGDWREIFYILAGAFVIIAYTYASTGKEATGAAVLLGAIFIMLGCSQVFTWGQFSSWLPWYWQSSSKQASWAPAPPPAQVQLGVWTPITLGPTPVELDPGGRYKILWHEIDQSQCIKVYGPSDQYLGNDCNGSVDLHDTAKFASAGDEPVSITYVLSMGP
jgi:hypothetical protein